MNAKSNVTWYETDSIGNILYVKKNKIYIYIAAEERHRLIASINIKKKYLSITRKSTHLHKKTHSYGFNECVIRSANICKNVVLNCPEGKFTISIEEIIKNAGYLHFKKQGFEKQIFLPLSYIQQNKNTLK